MARLPLMTSEAIPLEPNRCTMFHVGQDWGLHEANVSRLVRNIEDILSKSKKFSLPSKRRLLEEAALTSTIVDVTEMMIECPKKNNSGVTAEKRSDTP